MPESNDQPFTGTLRPESSAKRPSRFCNDTPAHVARNIFFISLRRSLMVEVRVRGMACSGVTVVIDWTV
jgi:hypothetical protein